MPREAAAQNIVQSSNSSSTSHQIFGFHNPPLSICLQKRMTLSLSTEERL